MAVDEGSDVGGPMIGVCAGHRCAALWRRRDPAGTDRPVADLAGVASLRAAVRGTRGAVLTSLGCVGACAQGALVGVADRRAGTTETGEVAWVVGADAPERLAAVTAWIEQDWDDGVPPPPGVLRDALCRMVRVGGAESGEARAS